MSKSDIVNVLNRLFILDPQAMKALVESRVVVTSKKMIDSPDVQLLAHPDTKNKAYLGILGVLNALMPGGNYIAAMYNDSNEMSGFVLIDESYVNKQPELP